eukprot:Skav206023  [mRNA]  locus=C9320687:2752:3516:+ [translate_table: standard]
MIPRYASLCSRIWECQSSRLLSTGVLRDVGSHAVIQCDVADPCWACAIHNFTNVGWTVSFPCPPFSRGSSKKLGLECREGRDILEVLRIARFTRPLFITLDNADEFSRHPHAPFIRLAIRWAGFRIAWSQVHDMSDLSPHHRRRWIAVCVRADLLQDEFVQRSSFKIFDDDMDDWSSPSFRFLLPRSLEHQLEITEELYPSYAACEFLPVGMSEVQVMDARTARYQAGNPCGLVRRTAFVTLQGLEARWNLCSN